MKSILIILITIFLLIFSSCTSQSDIKDNFCGIHINYQYCKCAFHNEYCENIGMNKNEAKELVYSEYNIWKNKSSNDDKYGIIEKNGKLYLNSKPGETLSIKTKDLPNWAQEKIATIGATIVTVTTPDTIISGDKNVLLDELPIARINDKTAHGGTIITGSKKIFVNGKAVAIIGGETIDPTIIGNVPSVGGKILNNVN